MSYKYYLISNGKDRYLIYEYCLENKHQEYAKYQVRK
jgi:hypothetical protein